MKFLAIIFLIKYAESAIRGLIVGGTVTTSLVYPYQVFLDMHGRGCWVCGGSFLNQVLVLTAAHCLEDLGLSNDPEAFIKYGSEVLNKNMKMRRMKSYIVHPRYDFESMFADLGLVLSRKPVRFGTLAQRVAIMRRPPTEAYGYVSGWGVIDENLGNTEILKHARQKIYTGEACKPLQMPNGSFCAGNAGAKDDFENSGYPAMGDSGGPLVIVNLIQIGIVSYRVKGQGVVAYTNVSYFMPWIRRNAPEMYCEGRM